MEHSLFYCMDGTWIEQGDRHIDVCEVASYGFFGSDAQAQLYGAKIHTIK
jgi:hypothetical protein